MYSIVPTVAVPIAVNRHHEKDNLRKKEFIEAERVQQVAKHGTRDAYLTV